MKGNRQIIELKGINKTYGAVQALNNVDFELQEGEVLGLVGDNGAGKSTLIKIISGVILADSGEFYFEGEKINIRGPHDSRNLGIETVYQDLALLDYLDISKNMFIGREHRVGKFFYNSKKMVMDSENILKKLGINIPSIQSEVRFLSGGQRQAIAVGRAAFWGCKIVIMDEPTAALGVKESGKVIELIRNLKKNGLSMIIISHNLEHVFKIADRVIVLRKGQRVADRKITQTNGDEVVKLITGAEFV